MNNTTIFDDNSFFVGCNYWASHAGTNMWKDWNEDVVRADLKLLSEYGIKVLRVFPLWSDFQPLRMHLDNKGRPKEMRLGEEAMPHTREGEAGLDPVMIKRFQKFLDIGAEHDVKFVVGLITGWMSGRLFMPEALLGMNPITDARSLKWQIKFVRYMVNRFKEHSAIAAWDLGNECNCMGEVECSEQAYVWSAAITNTIKMCDNDRPVVSGMHGISTNNMWRAQDQGEITDILCTHPYSLYTKYCDTDPLNEMKTILHSTAQTILYRGLGRKKTFIEEIGALGPQIASETVAENFFRTCLYSAWAHNCLGAMWWCGFDQAHLRHTPYDWSGIERYLGLFRRDMTAKPIMRSVGAFYNTIAEVGELPGRIVDAVCIITHMQDPWKTAYGTFLITKKAGLDVEYTYIDNELPEANAYLLPGLKGSTAIYKQQLDAILDRVKAGAALYMSMDDLLLCDPLSDLVGLEPQVRCAMTKPVHVEVDGQKLRLQGQYRTEYKVLDGDVLLCDENGAPVLAKRAYGKGVIYFLAYPMEDIVAVEPNICTGENEASYEKIYAMMPELRNPQKKVSSDNPHVGVTEHPCADGIIKTVLVNYRPCAQSVRLDAGELQIKKIIGNADVSSDGVIQLGANDGAVIIFE